jgi:hypothetical protein
MTNCMYTCIIHLRSQCARLSDDLDERGTSHTYICIHSIHLSCLSLLFVLASDINFFAPPAVICRLTARLRNVEDSVDNRTTSVASD